MEKHIATRPSHWTDDFDPFWHLQQAFDQQMLYHDQSVSEKGQLVCKDKKFELDTKATRRSSESAPSVCSLVPQVVQDPVPIVSLRDERYAECDDADRTKKLNIFAKILQKKYWHQKVIALRSNHLRFKDRSLRSHWCDIGDVVGDERMSSASENDSLKRDFSSAFDE